MKELKESISQIFEYDNNDKEPEWISPEIQKTYYGKANPW